jgi:hypothetical protein
MSDVGHDEREPSAALLLLRRMTLGAVVLLIVQVAIGMVVNLYVRVPAHHPGAQASNYFSGSFHSVVWAVSHGALALAIHASLGLALVVLAIGVAVRALRIRPGAPSVCCVLAGLLIVGAGFNGASFVDYNQDANSLVMALLSLGALLCYVIGIYLLPSSV